MIADLLKAEGIAVSRETTEKLEIYANLLVKWQKAVNLVSPASLAEKERRHFLDSAQLFSFLPAPSVRLADLGSGAGFPGLVLAMMGAEDVHLVESDTKKVQFLKEVARTTQTPVTVHTVRIEDFELSDIEVITARALGDLSDLLAFQVALGAKTGLYLKGKSFKEEIDRAKKTYSFSCQTKPSLSDKSGVILKISSVSRETSA